MVSVGKRSSKSSAPLQNSSRGLQTGLQNPGLPELGATLEKAALGTWPQASTTAQGRMQAFAVSRPVTAHTSLWANPPKSLHQPQAG